MPKGGGTKGLDLSSLKPLSRTQTREILDRFEGVINEKAGSTVVSNRWAALKAADDVNYLARFNPTLNSFNLFNLFNLFNPMKRLALLLPLPELAVAPTRRTEFRQPAERNFANSPNGISPTRRTT